VQLQEYISLFVLSVASLLHLVLSGLPIPVDELVAVKGLCIPLVEACHECSVASFTVYRPLICSIAFGHGLFDFLSIAASLNWSNHPPVLLVFNDVLNF